MKPAFVSYHDAVRKIVALDSIPFQQLWWNFFAEVCSALSEASIPAGTNFASLPWLHSALFQFSLPFPWLILHFVLMNLKIVSFVSLDRGSSWAATVGADRWCLYLFLKLFFIVWHLVPMQSSPYARWSCVFVSDGGISPSAHNSTNAHCMSLPVILLHRNMTIWRWGRQHDFYSGVWQWMEVVIIYRALQYCMVFVSNSMMLIIFCTTFIRITPHERMWYIRGVQNFWMCYD